jgi:hypothetical protein
VTSAFRQQNGEHLADVRHRSLVDGDDHVVGLQTRLGSRRDSRCRVRFDGAFQSADTPASVHMRAVNPSQVIISIVKEIGVDYTNVFAEPPCFRRMLLRLPFKEVRHDIDCVAVIAPVNRPSAIATMDARTKRTREIRSLEVVTGDVQTRPATSS